ncbi:Acetylornithine deacetylase [Saccharolobus shibatae]|uniref:Acetylornithine deacetylase n=1 Tax=Saccharolobus shibatae TaxID=2286 RepID=A0A8F5BWT8_9CREN|nr:Acetylornithine deacetylase [Saccharolobus shibatae]QXJ35960.1 Acetylornithine deacetylase [Saccharolobus shibatae]
MVDPAKLLKDLIQIKTVNLPGLEYENIPLYLKYLFNELGFQIQLIEIPEEYMDKYYIYSPSHIREQKNNSNCKKQPKSYTSLQLSL